jgi:hypothetical protein
MANNANNHNVNARLTSVNRNAADEFNYKAHAQDGICILTDTDPAPVAQYYGIKVLAEAVVASITYVDSSKQTGDAITTVTALPVGMYIPIPGLFTTLTLTSGEVLLLKKNN